MIRFHCVDAGKWYSPQPVPMPRFKGYWIAAVKIYMGWCTRSRRSNQCLFRGGCACNQDRHFLCSRTFRVVQQQKRNRMARMYKVFNMGHLFEIYADAEAAGEIISISKSFGIVAHHSSGRTAQGKKVTIHSEVGTCEY